MTVSLDTLTLCSMGVSTPEGLQLLRDAGFYISPEVWQYHDVQDYLEQLKIICKTNRRMIIQHVHPAAEIPPDRCWIPPAILSFVNNKGNLPGMADAEHIPTRRIIASGLISSDLLQLEAPFVVKAATDESTSGGVDLIICRTVPDLKRAADYFKGCTHVVVEKFFHMVQNLCLNYAVDAAGCITYLGGAEQICDSEGKYLGNWLGDDVTVPKEAVEIGKRVVEKGFQRGFYGVVGMDMAVLEDGRILVFDLNFRFNGSTPTLLLYESIKRQCNKNVMRLRSLRVNGLYRDLLQKTYAAMQRGFLLPLNSFDPVAGGYPQERPSLRCLVMGWSRKEVQERERELSSLGFLL